MAQFTHTFRQGSFVLMLLVGAGLWLGSSKPVQACACDTSKHGNILVWPQATKNVPLSTKIWVRLPAYNTTLPYEKYSDFQKHPRFWSQRFLQKQMPLLLVHKNKNKYIPVYKTDLALGEWRMSVLQPGANLQPKQTYEVHIQGPGNLFAVLHTFTTGTESTTKDVPPAGVSNARYLWERPYKGACGPQSDYITVNVDANAAKNALFFGVWIADASGKINEKAMPHLVLQPKDGRLFLGKASRCKDRNFIFPKGQTKFTLGIRAGNIAGKWSPTETVTVSAQAMAAPWTWSPGGRVGFWLGLGFVLVLLSVVRTWLFQRSSNNLLDDFLTQHDEIQNDMAWIALKQMVQRENGLRRNNFIVFFLQIVISGLAIYVFVKGLSHFSSTPQSLSEHYLQAAILVLVLLLNAIIHLFLTFQVRTKRRKIKNFPKSKLFQATSQELLSRW